MEFEVKNSNSKKKKKNSNNNIMIIIAIFFLVLAILLMVYYFYRLTTPKKTKQVQAAKPKVVEQVEKSSIKIVNDKSNDRPIAIMIDNNIGENKHAGLQDSYINYEMIVEGGLTRIMALYKDKAVGLIGPVRSSRNYFLDYALEHDAIYVHYGWSPSAEDDISTLGVNNINGLTDPTPFARDSSIASPHNVFTSIGKIKSYVENKGYSKTSEKWKVLNYSSQEIDLNQSKSDSQETHKVEIEYSYYQTRSYTYDSVNQYYLRSQNGEAHLDRVSGNQLYYKNIIILKVDSKTIDSEGRQQLTTTGKGTGYYITNGYSVPINWTKTSRSDKTIYTYLDGTDVTVNDGNTFIQIVPTTNQITIE